MDEWTGKNSIYFSLTNVSMLFLINTWIYLILALISTEDFLHTSAAKTHMKNLFICLPNIFFNMKW